MANQMWRVFTAEKQGQTFSVISTLWTDRGPQADDRKVLRYGLDEDTATRMAALTQHEYDTVRWAMESA